MEGFLSEAILEKQKLTIPDIGTVGSSPVDLQILDVTGMNARGGPQTQAAKFNMEQSLLLLTRAEDKILLVVMIISQILSINEYPPTRPL